MRHLIETGTCPNCKGALGPRRKTGVYASNPVDMQREEGDCSPCGITWELQPPSLTAFGFVRQGKTNGRPVGTVI